MSLNDWPEEPSIKPPVIDVQAFKGHKLWLLIVNKFESIRGAIINDRVGFL